MEELSLSLWDILLLPVALPLRSAVVALSYLQDEVEKERGSEQAVWESLLELEVLKEIGQISDQEYEQQRLRLESRLPANNGSSWKGDALSDDE